MRGAQRQGGAYSDEAGAHGGTPWLGVEEGAHYHIAHQVQYHTSHRIQYCIQCHTVLRAMPYRYDVSVRGEGIRPREKTRPQWQGGAYRDEARAHGGAPRLGVEKGAASGVACEQEPDRHERGHGHPWRRLQGHAGQALHEGGAPLHVGLPRAPHERRLQGFRKRWPRVPEETEKKKRQP